MSRSLWKTPFSVLRSSRKKEAGAEEQIWSRASTVLPIDLGKQVCVHNGKNWVRVQVVEQMVAHKYGEFASTRRKALHKSKSSQQSSRKK